jgi:hypothetical protein
MIRTLLIIMTLAIIFSTTAITENLSRIYAERDNGEDELSE